MAIDEKKLKKDLLRWFSGKKQYCINNGLYDLLNDFEDCFDAFEDIINAQPKLSLENKTSDKWIPCSERLPEKSGWYLVTVSDGEIEFDQFFAGEPNHSWRGFCHNTVKTIAWMPLPEPYKGDE